VCERRHFLVPTHWLHAGGDPSRHNHADQQADRPLVGATPLRCPLHSSRLPCAHPSRSPCASIAPTIMAGGKIKSPYASLLASAQLPATSCLGAFWTPAACVRGASPHCRRPKTCTMHNAQCTMHNAQCTMHNAQLRKCTVRIGKSYFVIVNGFATSR